MMTKEEIIERTGLAPNFVNKCIKELKPVLKPHIKRGDSNRIFFTSNGIVIFENIKRMKEEGYSLPQIKEELEKISPNQPKAQPNQPLKGDENRDQTDQSQELVSKLIEAHKMLAEEKEKKARLIEEKSREIQDLSSKYQALNTAIKLLPEGKSPEQIKSAWEEEQKKKQEINRIIGELKSLGTLRFRKRKQLIRRLEELSD